jgi:ankyrin repeat protein
MELAARKDHVELVRWLASRGGKPQDILSAAILGQAELIEKFLRKDRRLLKARTSRKQTPLHLAAVTDQAQAAAVLLAHGASPRARDTDGLQVIHTAALSGADGVLRELLTAGVSAWVSVDKDKQFQPLHCAAFAGRLEVVRTLLDRGVSVHVRIKDTRDTPLHLAAIGVDEEATRLLHKLGIRPPAAGGHADVVRLLLARGARTHGLGWHGHTPLHLAVEGNHLAAVSALLTCRADVNAKGDRRQTPLHLAVVQGNAPMVLLLMHHGADSTARDVHDRTPLDLARENPDADILRILGAKRGKR